MISALLAGLLVLLVVQPVHAQDERPVLRASVPLEIVHREGQPLRFGLVVVQAGDIDGPIAFRMRYDDSTEDLGPPAWATWLMVVGNAYCRDQPTWVETVLTGPSGQTWRSPRHGVPAGLHSPVKVFGFGDADDHPGLFEAFALGGRFMLTLENSEGERLNETVIETLDSAERERLFVANRATLRATLADSVPLSRPDRMEYRRGAFGSEAPPVLACPKA